MAKEDWRRSPAFRAFGVVVVLACAATALIWAFGSLSAGRYALTVVALAAATSMLSLTVAMVLQLVGLVDRAAQNLDGGTDIEPDRVQTELMRVVHIGFGLASALLVFLAFSGNLPVLADRIDERAQYKAVGGAVVVLIMSVCTVRRWFVRNGPVGYVRLTPRGFEFSSGGRGKHYRWDELTDVTDEATGKYRIPDVVNFHTRDGSVGWIPARPYTTDPAGLNQFIRYYWEHPERRVELADGRATRRWLSSAPGAPAARKPDTQTVRPSSPTR